MTAAASLVLMGCSLPIVTPAPTAAAGAYVATIGAMQTSAVQTAGAQGIGATATPPPPATLLPVPTGAPDSPLVNNDTLCWRGPGPTYEVISALKQGTAVSLLGRGVISGWFVIRNPIYGDPCWVQANYLQIPASVNVSVLPLYNPPWTPTPTSAFTATPGATSTP